MSTRDDLMYQLRTSGTGTESWRESMQGLVEDFVARLTALESRGAGARCPHCSAGDGECHAHWCSRYQPPTPPPPADPGEKWLELARRWLGDTSRNPVADLAAEFARIDREGCRRGYEQGLYRSAQEHDAAIAEARADERERVLEKVAEKLRAIYVDCDSWALDSARDAIAALRRGKP